MKTAIELIADERQRQIEVEGWTPEHDDQHNGNELLMAGVSYALADRHRIFNPSSNQPPVGWPWDSKWWKPSPDDRIRELTKAGALIVAEIERLQRLESI